MITKEAWYKHAVSDRELQSLLNRIDMGGAGSAEALVEYMRQTERLGEMEIPSQVPKIDRPEVFKDYVKGRGFEFIWRAVSQRANSRGDAPNLMDQVISLFRQSYLELAESKGEFPLFDQEWANWKIPLLSWLNKKLLSGSHPAALYRSFWLLARERSFSHSPDVQITRDLIMNSPDPTLPHVTGSIEVMSNGYYTGHGYVLGHDGSIEYRYINDPGYRITKVSPKVWLEALPKLFDGGMVNPGRTTIMEGSPTDRVVRRVEASPETLSSPSDLSVDVSLDARSWLAPKLARIVVHG